ncbi:hypothetical protein RSAG8_04118, partial [Rhizoctonia solani AG-8 WAC10335]
MSTNPSNDKLAQIKKLREQRAQIDRMINTLVGDSTEGSAGPSHIMPLLGFTDFKKPPPNKRDFNLQSLCGLTDRMWSIFKQELRDVAVKQGVDTRVSLKSQLTQQCITDSVNEIIKLRPEIKQKLSDPDWFIRQTLRAMLKSSSESYRNLANDKPPRPRKVKIEDTEMVEPSNTDNQVVPQVTASSDSNQKSRRPKEKKPSWIEGEDEDTEARSLKYFMTVPSGIKNQARPQTILSSNPNINRNLDVGQELLRPQGPKTRPTAGDLHIIRDPEWSSPPKSPFAPQEDDFLFETVEGFQQDASDDEPPTPKPRIKNLGIGTHQGSKKDRWLGMVNAGPTSKAIAKHPLAKALVAYDDIDSDEGENREPTTKKLRDLMPEDEQNTFNIPNDASAQKNKLDSQFERATILTTEPHIQPIGNPNTSVRPAPSTQSTTAPRKRKGRDEDTSSESETPAPKKGKKPTIAALKTPARVMLTKNFETPLPASPLHAARVTRAKGLSSQGASSSSAPPPAAAAIPAVIKSKAQVRKEAAMKAAATRAANKKAREEGAKAKAQNESNTRKGKK